MINEDLLRILFQADTTALIMNSQVTSINDTLAVLRLVIVCV